MDRFFMSLRLFMCARGTPSRVQSYRDNQLVAASKQTEHWDFEGVRQWAGKRGIEGHFVPTGGHISTDKLKE